MDRNQLEKMKIAELREAAAAEGIKNITKMKKQELIDALCENKLKEENNSELREKNITADRNIDADGEKYSDPVRRTNLMSGVLEIMADGYGFLRSDNYQS